MLSKMGGLVLKTAVCASGRVEILEGEPSGPAFHSLPAITNAVWPENREAKKAQNLP